MKLMFLVVLSKIVRSFTAQLISGESNYSRSVRGNWHLNDAMAKHRETARYSDKAMAVVTFSQWHFELE